MGGNNKDLMGINYMMHFVFGTVVMVVSAVTCKLLVFQPVVLLIVLVTTVVIMKQIVVFQSTYIIVFFTFVPIIIWFVRLI